MDKEQEFLTIDEATREYPFTRTTIYRLHRDNKLRFYSRPGTRQTLLARSDLEALAKPQPKDPA